MRGGEVEADQNEEDEGLRVRKGQIRVNVEIGVVDGGSGVRSCLQGRIMDVMFPAKPI